MRKSRSELNKGIQEAIVEMSASFKLTSLERAAIQQIAVSIRKQAKEDEEARAFLVRYEKPNEQITI